MLKGHQDILWLAGQVLLDRNFIQEAEEKGLDAIFKEAPYGDLTEEEKATFRAAFEEKELRQVVEKWWSKYDEKREIGILPQAGFWE